MKPLKDLSQGSRIAFARQFRSMSKDDVADKLGLSGEDKGKNMTRWENGERISKNDKLLEIAEILKVSTKSIKPYDYKEQ